MTQNEVLTILRENDINGSTYYDMLYNTIDGWVLEHFGGVEALISSAYSTYKTNDCSFCFAIVCGAEVFARDLILDRDWNLLWTYRDGVEFLSLVCEVLEEIYNDAKEKGLNVEEESEFDFDEYDN